MPDVFISYNREDRETARLVSSALESEGFSVWWDAALRAGETYDEVTEHNLRTAGAVVVLWSKRSSNSKWVRAEATVGERSSTLVPALIEDCERPIRFELVQTADLRHWRGDRADPNWRGFIQDVRSAIDKKAPRPAAATPSLTSTDVSIETTFWNSIKDGTERSDFEAYLARYPAGHFSALAKNRLAALNRSSAPAPAAPSTAPPQPRPPQSQPARAAAAPSPKTSPPASKQKSGSGLMVGGLVAIVAVVGVIAFVLTRGGAPATTDLAAASVEPDTVAVAEPARVEPESAPAPDVLAENVATEQPMEVQAPSAPEPLEPAPPPAPADSGVYRDCDQCPLMARLPGGTFLRGSPDDEPGRNAYEGPQREVTVPTFAMGVYEVTREEWNACSADGGCPDKGYSADGLLPALGVSFREGERYASWLSKKTGKSYRIPTEAEWEYAARGGAATAYWWGPRYESGKAATGAPAPVGTHAANAFGLHDVTGNAREWTADCYVNNFVNAPDDGRAVTEGDCGKRVVRGGAWSNPPGDLRVANRSRIDAGVRAQYMGLRVAADLN
ncbi:MAG: SUMF1/EgtB/PvdO family nonheme iron enzyme [Parvularculaceae bacterium]|nr:SUMF1/EgtB/PvdO family nonheme iron enzyme [Parvularculaceae bacterium]